MYNKPIVLETTNQAKTFSYFYKIQTARFFIKKVKSVYTVLLYINSLLTRHKEEKYFAFDTVDSYAALKRFAVLSW